MRVPTVLAVVGRALRTGRDRRGHPLGAGGPVGPEPLAAEPVEGVAVEPAAGLGDPAHRSRLDELSQQARHARHEHLLVADGHVDVPRPGVVEAEHAHHGVLRRCGGGRGRGAPGALARDGLGELAHLIDEARRAGDDDAHVRALDAVALVGEPERVDAADDAPRLGRRHVDEIALDRARGVHPGDRAVEVRHELERVGQTGVHVAGGPGEVAVDRAAHALVDARRHARPAEELLDEARDRLLAGDDVDLAVEPGHLGGAHRCGRGERARHRQRPRDERAARTRGCRAPGRPPARGIGRARLDAGAHLTLASAVGSAGATWWTTSSASVGTSSL